MIFGSDLGLASVVAWMANFFCFSSLLIASILALEWVGASRWRVAPEALWKAVVPLSLLAAFLLLDPATPGTAVQLKSDHGRVSQATTTRTPAPIETTSPAAVSAFSKTLTSPQQPASAMAPAKHFGGVSWAAVMAGIYGLWILIGLARLRRDLRHTRSFGRQMETVDDPGACEALAQLARQAGCSIPELRSAPTLRSPLSMADGTIGLPGWALTSLNRRQLKAMLAHELAHIVRHDVHWSIALRITQVMLPIQPLLGIVRKRVSHYAELACDDWAVAATGCDRELAESLERCVEEIVVPNYRLVGALGMAESQIVQRVARLLDTTPLRIPSLARTIALLSVVTIACVVIAPGVALSEGESRGRTVEVINDDGESRGSMKLNTPERKLKAKYTGRLTFSDEFNDIESLERNGYFRLTDQFEGVRRKLELEAGRGGELIRTYEVDGDPHAWDGAAQAWFGATIEFLLRETGMAAERRVTFLLERGGADAVIREIGLIKSDHVARIYTVALSAARQMTAEELKSLLAHLETDLKSDFEMRTALSALWSEQGAASAAVSAFLGAAATVQSDFEARTLLTSLAESMPSDADEMKQWLSIAETIQSDFELRSALTAVTQRDDITAATIEHLLKLALEIQSDFELRSLLVEIAGRAAQDDETAMAYLKACEDLQSDFEMAQAVQALLQEDPAADATWIAAFDLLAADLGSDHEMANLLAWAAPEMPASAEVRAAFNRALDEVRGHERDRVAQALSH